jgi:hypothetical protein
LSTRVVPPVLLFGYPLTIGVQVTRQLTLYNNGKCQTSFSWKHNPASDEFYEVSFSPEKGTIPAGKSTKIWIKFTPFFIGDLNENFICEVEHSKQIALTISAKVSVINNYTDRIDNGTSVTH